MVRRTVLRDRNYALAVLEHGAGRRYHLPMSDGQHAEAPVDRRRRTLIGALTALAVPVPALARTGRDTLRIGLTPVFLDEQISFTNSWRLWLEQKLGRSVRFVQRGNYREMVDLLLSGKLDCAWLCGYPYVRQRTRLKLVAVPLWQGRPLYQSYLITARTSTRIQSLADLRGKIFAYSDPDSNSGFLYPQYVLRSQNENPASYFSRTFFTWAHRNVVEAVSLGLADGGAVDGYVWEMLARTQPALTDGTRIFDRSPLLGFPPFVARADLPAAELATVREALTGMATDPVGVKMLGQLGLDGFTPGNHGLFDGITHMVQRVSRP